MSIWYSLSSVLHVFWFLVSYVEVTCYFHIWRTSKHYIFVHALWYSCHLKIFDPSKIEKMLDTEDNFHDLETTKCTSPLYQIDTTCPWPYVFEKQSNIYLQIMYSIYCCFFAVFFCRKIGSRLYIMCKEKCIPNTVDIVRKLIVMTHISSFFIT